MNDVLKLIFGVSHSGENNFQVLLSLALALVL